MREHTIKTVFLQALSVESMKMSSGSIEERNFLWDEATECKEFKTFRGKKWKNVWLDESVSFEWIEGKRFMTVRYQIVTRITDIMFYHSQLLNAASLSIYQIFTYSQFTTTYLTKFSSSLSTLRSLKLKMSAPPSINNNLYLNLCVINIRLSH